MRAISGSHACPECKAETTYKRHKSAAKLSDWDSLERMYLTRPGKAWVAALSDKNAWVHECDKCEAIVAQCPYCRTINKVDPAEADADCSKCTNMFIVHR